MSAALRWLRLSPGDAAITAGVVVWAATEAILLDHGVPVGWRLGFALAVTLAMVLRNRWPAATLAAAIGAFVAELRFDPLPIEAVTPIQLLPLATYALAAFGADRRASRLAALLAVAVPAVLFVPLVRDAPATLRDVVSLLVMQAVASGAGWAVRRRREDAERQAASLRAAGLDADELVREGVEEERARIARELRGIVARALAGMDVRLRAAEAAGAASLAAIAADLQARAAGVMADLQRLLEVLPTAPGGVVLPVSAEAAVAAARGRGWDVTLAGDGAAGEASAGSVLAAGRVVEEVLAGAPPPGGAAVLARADPSGDGVRIRLSGRGVAPEALADPAARSSLRERVRLHGGAARLVRRPWRWAVEATLPGASELRPDWRAHALGDVVVVGAACLVVADDARSAGGAGPLTSVVLGALFFVLPLALRRRAPLAAVLVVGAGLLGLELADVLPDYSRTTIIAALLASGAAAMHVAAPRIALGAAVAVTASAVAVGLLQRPPGEAYTDIPIIVFMFVMAWGFGRVVRRNLDRVHHARAGEERLAAEQHRRLLAAVEEERRAVARDLHDVVAHGVSLVGVLAGAAAAQALRDPDRARVSLRSARAAVAQARAEVQRLTAALGDDAAASRAPTTIDDIRMLAVAARRAGQTVDCRIDVPDPALVPGGVVASAYRIVQEALTNARKHAPGAAAAVRISQAHGALHVEVRNGPAPASDADGTRRGIAGMRERARLLGGELRAAPEPGGGFEVRARLPVA